MDKKNYKDVTKEEIEQALKELFPDHGLSYQELKDKILDGYWYKIMPMDLTESHKDSRNIAMNTGRGGVLMFLDQCEKYFIPAGVIAENIFAYVEGAYHCILNLNHKKNTPDKLNLEDKTLTDGDGQ